MAKHWDSFLSYCKSTIFNITRHFLYHGIPFSTVIPKSALPPPLPYRDAPTLGWCPHGYEVKAFEYAFYHDKLHLFFKQSYSHAALSMGGIVWRLAHAMVNDDLVDSVVVNGPSDAAGKQCSSVEFTNGEILCDDNLTEGELDFICGVYKVATATGKITTFGFCSCTDVPSGRAKQTADMSWWPKHNTFMRSSLWQGYWSPACESWFQSHLTTISEQRTSLKSSKQWTKEISRYHKQSRNFLKPHRNAACEFLLGPRGHSLL